MTTKRKKAVANGQYSPKSLGSTAPVPANGHCPLSSTGAHWWKIEPPDGRVSIGVCKYCREQREFSNWIGAEFKR